MTHEAELQERTALQTEAVVWILRRTIRYGGMRQPSIAVKGMGSWMRLTQDRSTTNWSDLLDLFQFSHL